jgi:hypothetical protein
MWYNKDSQGEENNSEVGVGVVELDAFVGIGTPTSATNLFQKIFENPLTNSTKCGIINT